jgi:hypothetical protein
MIHNFYRWKKYPNYLFYLCNFHKNKKSKQPPNRRKFAQSGQPACYTHTCSIFAMVLQGCQIFLSTTYHIVNLPKCPQNIPNDGKIEQMTIKIPTPSITRPSKMYPNWDFWFENMYTIWQPCGSGGKLKKCSRLVHFVQCNFAFIILRYFFFDVNFKALSKKRGTFLKHLVLLIFWEKTEKPVSFCCICAKSFNDISKVSNAEVFPPFKSPSMREVCWPPNFFLETDEIHQFEH